MTEDSNITISVSAKNSIDLDALNLLASGSEKQLCKCAYTEQKGKHHFIYSQVGDPVVVSRTQPLDFEGFLKLLEIYSQIVRLSITYHLLLENFKFNPSYIFALDEACCYVYVPVGNQKITTAGKVMQKAITSLKFKDTRVKHWLQHLKKVESNEILLDRLEKFIAAYVKRPISSTDNSEAETSLLSADTFSEAETSLLSADTFSEAETSLLSPDMLSEGETTILTETSAGSTESLMAYDTDTPVQGDKKKAELYLIRNRTNERVKVSGNSFIIGKDPNNADYCLDNNTVSRLHATIYCEDNVYFVMDNKSTNGTTVEGIKLRPYEKTELSDEAIISFGNESFQIQLERG